MAWGFVRLRCCPEQEGIGMKWIMATMAMAVASPAMPQGLDAPVNEHPTVRSEIQKGYDTGQVCTGYDKDARYLDSCFSRILTQYRLSHESTDAFEVGLNIRRWMAGVEYVRVGEQLRGNRLAQDYALSGKISALDAETSFAIGIAKLRITADDAFMAAGVPSISRPKSMVQN